MAVINYTVCFLVSKTMAGYFISLLIFWESLMRKAASAK